ncbi:MAG: AAA family ATPase [Okeania sp. SIO2G4]|uniref:AAA family ATPase n=1 Tax=unclassified Okeania TaxID=2634635 RepID=UPI0013B87A73|nr:MULTISPECIES: AAA family ATPase [unclassified Okeania]NEP41396.1 AAA family ATPase [Okeania sp. SIO2H7]NEP73180.1 AAA family ATPase [Okeania sp. SIO2G5]NEP94043.1 AAA family ATPase [Okeania sp. SIO2F5]NEQ91874.1 AAA family ATPase [Okeania sp. SIO2G4]
MKLISIILCNFRQFYGKTPEIILASGQKNTTIIHGNNGAGKTTIMNAFTWVLYEKFSAAFIIETQLVNKRAITEAKLGKAIACWVEIVFEHDNKWYQAKRLSRAYRNEKNEIEHGKSELYMQIAGDDGRWSPPPEHPDDIIGRILPESLHRYFFFDGERIEYIVRDDRKSEIAEATKELLGIEVLNRSVKHLGEAKKSLETDLRLIGNPETKKLLKEKNQIEQEINKLSKRQTEIEKELQDHREVKKEISSRLVEFKGAEGLPQQKDQLNLQIVSIKEQILQAHQGLKRAISTRGYMVFLSDAIEKFRELFGNLKEKGELPIGIKRQFVQQLLEKQRCICGAELTIDSLGRKSVEKWMEKAEIADVEETAIRMSIQIDEIDKQVLEFWDEVDRQQANIEKLRHQLSRVENELESVHKKLRNYPDEDIQQLQKRLDEIEIKVGNLNRETGSNSLQLETLNKEIKILDKQLDKQQMNELKQVLAQRRIAATQDAINRLIEVRARLEKQFRVSLEKRVQELFSEISFTPYIPKLNENYELTLVENTGGEDALVAASTGENQILSLAFIGSIIDEVRIWSQKNTLMGPDSSTFPIVMDSPFGSLDEIYRRQIANIIPQLANQLVVLVTKTQWRGEVAEEMADYIGREYVLSYNSPKLDCEEDAIQLSGESYPLVKRSPNEFEYTEVLEVDYD